MNATASRTLALARAAARRATARDLARRGGRAAFAGAGVAAGLAIADRVAGGLAPWPWLVITPIAAATLVACVWTLAFRVTPLKAVGEIDRTLRLRDRLSSAVALALRAGNAQDASFTEWAVADAEAAAAGVSLRRVMPLRPEWTWVAWPLLSAASIAAMLLIPPLTWETRAPVDTRRAAEREAATQKVAAAADAAREALEATPPDPATVEQLAALEELHAELTRGDVDPETARLRAARQLDGLAGTLEQEARQRALEQDALRERLAVSPRPKPDGARPGPASPLEEALRRGDLPAATRAADQLTDQFDRLSPEEQRDLAKDLEELSESLRAQEEAPPTSLPPRPPTGLTPEQTERLARENNPDEIARELERSGYEPETARREAERISEENRERQAEQSAREQLEEIRQSLREAAREARRQAEREPVAPPRDPARPDPGQEPTREPQRQPPEQAERKPGEQPERQPREQPGLQPAPQPGQQPGEQPRPQPTEQPKEQPAPQPGQQPGEQPRPQPTEQPKEQPAPQPGQQPGEQPRPQPTEQPKEQPAPQPGQPGERPQPQPVPQPERQPGEPADPQPQPGGEITERPGGERPPPAGTVDEQPQPGNGVKRLRETLERLSRSQQDAQRRFEQSERLREMAREMTEQATPEDRDQMRRWAESFRGERSDLPAAPVRSWTGSTEPVDARRAPAGERPPGERVIAEWYSDRTPDPAGRLPPAAQGELREAARSAEQAIEQQVVPNRYADLVRRVFRRYGERAEPPPGLQR